MTSATSNISYFFIIYDGCLSLFSLSLVHFHFFDFEREPSLLPLLPSLLPRFGGNSFLALGAFMHLCQKLSSVSVNYKMTIWTSATSLCSSCWNIWQRLQAVPEEEAEGSQLLAVISQVWRAEEVWEVQPLPWSSSAQSPRPSPTYHLLPGHCHNSIDWHKWSWSWYLPLPLPFCLYLLTYSFPVVATARGRR